MRNSRLEVFCKKGVLRNFTKFTGKHRCQSLFLLSCRLKPATLLKKRSCTGGARVSFLIKLQAEALRDLLDHAMRCVIWYHLYILKNVKNAHGGVLLLVELKPATLLEITLLRGCFSRFLNCANGTKSRNASHMVKTLSRLRSLILIMSPK